MWKMVDVMFGYTKYDTDQIGHTVVSVMEGSNGSITESAIFNALKKGVRDDERDGLYIREYTICD